MTAYDRLLVLSLNLKLSTFLIVLALSAVGYVIKEVRRAKAEREHRWWFEANQRNSQAEMKAFYAKQREEREAELAKINPHDRFLEDMWDALPQDMKDSMYRFPGEVDTPRGPEFPR